MCGGVRKAAKASRASRPLVAVCRDAVRGLAGQSARRPQQATGAQLLSEAELRRGAALDC